MLIDGVGSDGSGGAAGAAADPGHGPGSADPAEVTDPAAAVREELATIGDALARLRETDWCRLPEGELVAVAMETEAVLRSGFGVQVRVAGEVADRGMHDALGSRSAAHLLSQSLRIPVGQAKARIAAASAALPTTTPSGAVVEPEVPQLGDAIDAGDISDEHAKVITDCLDKLPDALDAETRSLCRDVLLDEAGGRHPVALRRVAEQIRLICDPDGTLSGKDPSDRMELHFGARRRDGLATVRGLLDPLTMEQLRVAVEDLAAPKPIDEHTPDPRSAPLRRAQALGEVLHRYLTGSASGGAPRDGGTRPQIGVTIRAEDLYRHDDGTGGDPSDGTCGDPDGDSRSGGSGHGDSGPAADRSRWLPGTATFDHGDPVSLPTARMLACDGDLIAQLLGGDAAVLDQRRAQRVFTRAQRRALVTRDKGCAFPGCDIPTAWCQAHHVAYWSHGGSTDLANGVLLCRRHHAMIHQQYWRINPAETARGRPWFIPPKHIDPNQRPRRNSHFHLPEILTAVRRE